MLTVPRVVSCNLKWFILLLLVGQNFHVHTKRNSRSNFSKRVWMVINNPSFVFARQNYCIQQNCFRAENGKNRDQMSCLEQLKLSAVEGSQWLLTAHQTLSHTNTHQPGVICHLTPNKMNVAPSVEAHSVLLEQKTEFSFSSFFFFKSLGLVTKSHCTESDITAVNLWCESSSSCNGENTIFQFTHFRKNAYIIAQSRVDVCRFLAYSIQSQKQ